MNLIKSSFLEIISNLNLILLLIGFPLFTLFAYGTASEVSNNILSVLFRGFHLCLALLVIILTKDRFYLKDGMPLILLFVLLLFRIIYDGYIRLDFIEVPRNVALMLFVEPVGFTFIPVVALACSFCYIDLDNDSKICYWGLLIMMITFIFRYISGSALVDNGRVSLSAAQSTLALAKYGGWLAIFSYYFYMVNKGVRNNILYVITFLLGAYCSLIAGSRGAVMGSMFALFFLYVIKKRQLLQLCIPFFFIFLLFYFFLDDILKLFYDLFPTLFKRFSATINKGDTSGRIEIFRYCIEQFWNNPILGDWMLKGNKQSIHLTAHNLTLEVLSCLGIVGMSFLVYLYLKLLYAVYKLRHCQTNLIWCALFFCMFIMSFSGGSIRNTDYSCIYMIILLLYGKQKYTF